MDSEKTLKYLVLLALALALTVGCAVLASTPATTLEPGSISVTEVPLATEAPEATATTAPAKAETALPKPGKWLVKADFEDFELYVNPESSGINRLVFPGVEVNTKDESGYPIIDGQFKMNLSWIRLEGKFDPSGVSASGTYVLTRGGSGPWTAVPAE